MRTTMSTNFVEVKDVATQDELRAAGLLWWNYSGYATGNKPIYVHLKPHVVCPPRATQHLADMFLGSYGILLED